MARFSEYYEDYLDLKRSPLLEEMVESYKQELEIEVAEKRNAISAIGVIAPVVTAINGFILSMGSAVLKLASRIVLNPYFMGTLLVASAAGGLFYFIKSKLDNWEVPAIPNFSLAALKERLVGLFVEDEEPPVRIVKLPTSRKQNGSSSDMVKAMNKNSAILTSVVKASEEVGVDPKLMLGILRAESTYGTYTKSKTSRAQGVFQIMPTTWDSHYKDFKSKYGIPEDDPNHVYSAAVFSAAYVKHIILPKLYKVTKEPTATDIYLSYVFGPSGGSYIAEQYRKNPSKIAYEDYSRKSYAKPQIKANRSYFWNPKTNRPRTYAQLYGLAASKAAFTQSEQYEVARYVGAPASYADDYDDEISVVTTSISNPYDSQQLIPMESSEEPSYEIVRDSRGSPIKVTLST